MLGTAYVQIHVAPVLVGVAAYKRLAVARIHVTQIVRARSGKSRHRTQLDGIPLGGSPALGPAERRLALLGRQILIYLRQQQRQLILWKHVGNVILVIYGERLAPVTLTA